MKNFFHIQIVDLRHQIDHKSPKKVRIFEENRNDPANARICCCNETQRNRNDIR